MIWNIVDSRRRKYRWRTVNAVIENVEHDNACKDADQFEDPNDAAPIYAELKGVSLHEAIVWAESEEGKVTLFLYDEGDGI